MRTIIFILLFNPFNGFSQTISGVIGVSASNTAPKSGYARAGSPFGIQLREDLNKHVFLTQSALFRFDGYYFKKDLPPEIENNDTIRDLGYKSICHQFNYLEFPFMINLSANKRKFTPYIGTGISFKFNVRSVERIAIFYRNYEFNELKLQNYTDINLIGSLGIQFEAIKHPVSIEGRFNHGLINVINNKTISSASILLIIR